LYLNFDVGFDVGFLDDTDFDVGLVAGFDPDFIHPLLNGVFLGGGCRQFVDHKMLEK
jgi:hypothetical protein